MRRVVQLGLAFLLASVCFAQPSRAIILYSSATRNTSAPTGAYLNSGWQYEGLFDGYLGTVISKKFFITAGHIGGAINDNFVFNGVNHRIVQEWGDPNSDLRIYQTVGSYNINAPLFKDSTEVGRSVVMIGRGTQRGDAVMANGVVHGWMWGAHDAVESWGRNAVSAIVTGGPQNADLLQMPFDAVGTQYEGAFSDGDSGGAVFVKQGTVWKLAGINYSADGQFSNSSNGSNPFNASIFNRGQLWQNGVGFTLAANGPPGSSYATRISSQLKWINGVLGGAIAPGLPAVPSGNGVPEPASVFSILCFACAKICSRRARG